MDSARRIVAPICSKLDVTRAETFALNYSRKLAYNGEAGV